MPQHTTIEALSPEAAKLAFIKQANETLVGLLHRVESLSGIYTIAIEETPCGDGFTTDTHMMQALPLDRIPDIASAIVNETNKTLAHLAEALGNLE